MPLWLLGVAVVAGGYGLYRWIRPRRGHLLTDFVKVSPTIGTLAFVPAGTSVLILAETDADYRVQYEWHDPGASVTLTREVDMPKGYIALDS
jgi:hypothetical protein